MNGQKKQDGPKQAGCWGNKGWADGNPLFPLPLGHRQSAFLPSHLSYKVPGFYSDTQFRKPCEYVKGTI